LQKSKILTYVFFFAALLTVVWMYPSATLIWPMITLQWKLVQTIGTDEIRRLIMFKIFTDLSGCIIYVSSQARMSLYILR